MTVRGVARRLPALLEREEARFVAAHPASARLAAEASGSLLGGVPDDWMAKWPGPFPVFLDRARGARLEDVDGHAYVDLCLGDTGAMAGHSPRPVADAVTERLTSAAARRRCSRPRTPRGWPALLADRFGLPTWSFALSATDANRWVLRLCPAPHAAAAGSSCSTSATTARSTRPSPCCATAASCPGTATSARPADVATTTRVCAFNDLDAVERELAHGDVACVLTEPALTNIGIVLPEPGFLDGLAAACRRDRDAARDRRDAHAQRGLRRVHARLGPAPDVVTIGKAIAGGVPIGAFGLTAELAARVLPARRRPRRHRRRRRHAGRQRAVAGRGPRHARPTC